MNFLKYLFPGTGKAEEKTVEKESGDHTNTRNRKDELPLNSLTCKSTTQGPSASSELSATNEDVFLVDKNNSDSCIAELLIQGNLKLCNVQLVSFYKETNCTLQAEVQKLEEAKFEAEQEIQVLKGAIEDLLKIINLEGNLRERAH